MACHMANELYPMNPKKFKEYVEWYLHKDDPIFYENLSLGTKVKNNE
jgi:hypothetical protein